MKDPIGDLCRLIERLPRDAQERFINHAAASLGHPSDVDTILPDRKTGKLKDVATTLEDLEAWMRHVVKDAHIDHKFLVRGLLYDISDDQRRAASPEHRAHVLDIWLGCMAEVDELLLKPVAERPTRCTDEKLQLMKSEYEEAACDAERLCDEAQAAHDAIESEWAQTFDDVYWREWTEELLGIAFGLVPPDESDASA